MMIGITGMGGSGKSTLARKLCELNNKCVHYELDEVRQEVLKLNELRQTFISIYSDRILTDGIFDKKKLFEIGFSNSDELDLINEVIIKYMYLIIDTFINKNKEKIILLDWFLLDKTKYFNICNKKILLIANKENRYSRIKLHDGMAINKIEKIEAITSNYSNSAFDFVVSTDKPISKELINRILGSMEDLK